MSSSAIDTNILELPASDQARTDITTTGSTTAVTVEGAKPLKNLNLITNALAPRLLLDGNFRSCNFAGGAVVPERFTATGKVINSNFVLGNDSFKDVVKLEATVKKVTLADFKQGDKLKYKGETYTANDIRANGRGFEGLSTKQIRLA